jgi:hypothetical protein
MIKTQSSMNAGFNFESSRNGSDALQQFVELGETAAGWSPIHPAFAPRESDGEAEAKLLEAKKALADAEVRFQLQTAFGICVFTVRIRLLEKGWVVYLFAWLTGRKGRGIGMSSNEVS